MNFYNMNYNNPFGLAVFAPWRNAKKMCLVAAQNIVVCGRRRTGQIFSAISNGMELWLLHTLSKMPWRNTAHNKKFCCGSNCCIFCSRCSAKKQFFPVTLTIMFLAWNLIFCYGLKFQATKGEIMPQFEWDLRQASSHSALSSDRCLFERNIRPSSGTRSIGDGPKVGKQKNENFINQTTTHFDQMNKRNGNPQPSFFLSTWGGGCFVLRSACFEQVPPKPWKTSNYGSNPNNSASRCVLMTTFDGRISRVIWT